MSAKNSILETETLGDQFQVRPQRALVLQRLQVPETLRPQNGLWPRFIQVPKPWFWYVLLRQGSVSRVQQIRPFNNEPLRVDAHSEQLGGGRSL